MLSRRLRDMREEYEVDRKAASEREREGQQEDGEEGERGREVEGRLRDLVVVTGFRARQKHGTGVRIVPGEAVLKVGPSVVHVMGRQICHLSLLVSITRSTLITPYELSGLSLHTHRWRCASFFRRGRLDTTTPTTMAGASWSLGPRCTRTSIGGVRRSRSFVSCVSRSCATSPWPPSSSSPSCCRASPCTIPDSKGR